MLEVTADHHAVAFGVRQLHMGFRNQQLTKVEVDAADGVPHRQHDEAAAALEHLDSSEFGQEFFCKRLDPASIAAMRGSPVDGDVLSVRNQLSLACLRPICEAPFAHPPSM